MEDLVSGKCGAGHCTGQKIVGIEQLEPHGRSQVGIDARRIKNVHKEENQKGAWGTEVGLA